jgi:hypothetical protein
MTDQEALRRSGEATLIAGGGIGGIAIVCEWVGDPVGEEAGSEFASGVRAAARHHPSREAAQTGQWGDIAKTYMAPCSRRIVVKGLSRHRDGSIWLTVSNPTIKAWPVR